MIDPSFKFGLVVLLAWLLTWRLGPRHAAAAHRIWVGVLAAMALLFVARPLWLLVPVSGSEVLWPGFSADARRAMDTAFVIVYVTVAAALLARVWSGIFAVRRLRQSCRPVDLENEPRLRQLLGEIPLALYETDSVGPLSAGFLKPVVVLPSWWRTLDDEVLMAVLAHEVAHVQRRDGLIALLCALCEAAVWFHPAVWFATRRVRWFAELAADARGVRLIGHGAYAAALLAMAQRFGSPRQAVYSLAVGAQRQASRRIHALLEEAERGPAGRAVVVVAAVLVPLVVLMASVVKIYGVARGGSCVC